jgi:hypothetical protein
MNLKEIFVGIDVSKDHLDISVHPVEKTWQVVHDEAGKRQLSKELRRLKPALIVMAEDKKWIQKAIKKPGALKSELGVKPGKTISFSFVSLVMELVPNRKIPNPMISRGTSSRRGSKINPSVSPSYRMCGLTSLLSILSAYFFMVLSMREDPQFLKLNPDQKIQVLSFPDLLQYLFVIFIINGASHFFLRA